MASGVVDNNLSKKLIVAVITLEIILAFFIGAILYILSGNKRAEKAARVKTPVYLQAGLTRVLYVMVTGVIRDFSYLSQWHQINHQAIVFCFETDVGYLAGLKRNTVGDVRCQTVN